MVNIALVGYGQMGKIIEETAIKRGHKITVIVDPFCATAKKEIVAEDFKDVDVVIDFTHPSVAVQNIKKYCELRKNAVMGTTGWYQEMDNVKKMVKDSGIGFIWSGNFSIGVNMFFRMVRESSRIVNKVPDYDPYVVEFHHNIKADSPSGTAHMIADIMLEEIDRKDKIVDEKLDRKILPNELHVASVRGGSVPGTHIVGFDSSFDTIELKHVARSRHGFATGAVMAAEFVNGKKGFFDIDNMMDDIISRK